MTSCTRSLGSVAGDNPETRRSTPPGEGERRALSGYLPQYKVAAARILQVFEAGTLHAVAVADPDGGAVDDLQLLTGHLDALRVDGFQVKWSAKATPLADAELRGLIRDAVAGRALLQTAWATRTTPGGERVARTVIHLHTNRPLSTAGLRGPNVHGRGLTLPRFITEIWRPAQAGALATLDDVPEPWRPYVGELAAEAGVTEAELLAAAPDILIETDRRLPEDDRETGRAFLRDLRAFVLALQEAVADDRHLVVLDAEVFLDLVGSEYAARWRPRSQHTFPVPPDFQSMGATAHALERALAELAQGYLVLTGSPGSGKSTLLTQLLSGDPRLAARYYAFVPGNDTATRGEAHALLHDLLLALGRREHVRTLAPPRDEVPLLRSRLLARLEKIGASARAQGTVAIILIDGLDHVTRDPAPEVPFLRELPPPDQIPDGVLVVLGTRSIEDLPGPLQAEARQPGRHVNMAPMDRRSTRALAEHAGLAAGVQDRIWELSDGHPLLARTFVQLAVAADNPLVALAGIPALEGDIRRYYDLLWTELRADPDLVALLGLICRLRGPIDLDWLEHGGTTAGALARLERVRHLFRAGPGSRWSFFHDSFRELLIARTAERMGAYNEQSDRRFHAELAPRCAATDPSRPEAWEELHHRLRAGDQAGVLARATPGFFRRQLEALRPPDDVAPDVREAATALIDEHDTVALVRLVLSAAECSQRRYQQQVTGDFLELLSDLGRTDAAIAHLDRIRDNVSGNDRIVTALDFAASLHHRGLTADAMRVFERYEPLDLLANRGASRRELAGQRGPWQTLYAWGAAAALIQGPQYVVDQTERLVLTAADLDEDDDLAEATAVVKANILHSAAEALDRDDPATGDAILAALPDDGPGRVARASLLLTRAEHAADADAACALVEELLALEPHAGTRLRAAELLLRLGRPEDAAAAAAAAPLAVPPSPSSQDDGKHDWWLLLRQATVRSALEGELDPVIAVPDPAQSFSRARAIVARHVVRLANLWGRHLRGEPVSVTEITAAVRTVHALWDGTSPGARQDLWQTLGGRRVITESAVTLAASLGRDAVQDLWAWWQERWARPGRRSDGDLALVRAFGEAGIGPLSLRERLDAVAASLAADPNAESQDWADLGLARLAAGDRDGAHAALEGWTAATFKVGWRKDYQLSTWIRLLAPALGTRPALVPWLVAEIAELDRRAEAGAAHDAAKELVAAAGRAHPGEVLGVARSLLAEDAFSVVDAIESAARATAPHADAAWWTLVAEILVPLGGGAIPLDSAAAATPGSGALRAHLRAVAERVAVEGWPSHRRAWCGELVAAAGQHGLTAADIGITDAELERGEEAPSRERGGTTSPFDDALEGRPLDELLDLLESGEGYGRPWRALIDRFGELDDAQRGRLHALADDHEERGCELARTLAREALARGHRDDAWQNAATALRRSGPRDWSRNYSGGPALDAARILQDLDPEETRPLIFTSFAHAACADPFVLGSAAEDFDHVLPVFAPYDERAVADIILDYVAALTGSTPPDEDGPAPRPAPVSCPRMAAEIVVWLLGMVPVLAWSSAERAAIALLRSGGEAEQAVRDALLSADAPPSVVLGILAATLGDSAGDDVIAWLSERATGPRLDDRGTAAGLLHRLGAPVPRPPTRSLPPSLQLILARAPEILSGATTVGADELDEMLDLDGTSLERLASAAGVDRRALAEAVRARASDLARYLPRDADLATAESALGWGLVRPSALAVTGAEQELAAALADAGAVAPAVALAVLHPVLGDHAGLLARRPERRPGCVLTAAALEDRGTRPPEWLPGIAGAGDRLATTCDGWAVIGELTELSLLDRRQCREERDQALVTADADDLDFVPSRRAVARLRDMPAATLSDGLIVRTARASLYFADGALALHPAAARAAGMEPEDEDPLAWRLDGEPAVRSRWWRCGFVAWPPWSDTDEVGDGWLVVASPAAVGALLAAFPGAEVRWEVRRRERDQHGAELEPRVARGRRDPAA